MGAGSTKTLAFYCITSAPASAVDTTSANVSSSLRQLWRRCQL